MYIQYTMDQRCLPMDLEEDIPAHHLFRVVNAAVNRPDNATTPSSTLKTLETIRVSHGYMRIKEKF